MCMRAVSCRATCATSSVPFGADADRPLTRVLVDAGLASSTSEAGRKIQQGGVKIAGEKVGDIQARVAKSSLPLVVQAGRHAVRLIGTPEP